ncbi:hypothetical protein DL96DRAFT_1187872 [Flagelloscypha sp. PMI_526]|nr:hypothetical protein DL96DRAFT_1187872 [Flagelloscypha sp. PMI_526]
MSACERAIRTRLPASPMLTGPPTPSIPTSHPSNGVDVAMLDVMSPVDASVSRAREGELAMELNALRKVVDEQKQQLQSLQQDLYVAHCWTFPESRITESLPFQVVSRTLSFYQGHAHDLVKKKEELEKEYNALLEERSTYTNLAQSTAVQLDQDYQSRLEKRSTECARLRQERDQLRIALREREAKDSTALPSVSQLEALQRAQSARLDSSRAEVQRLRMRLADSTGNTEILSYLLDDDKDQTLVQRLQSRVQELEANVSSLQHGGPSLAPDSGDSFSATSTTRGRASSVEGNRGIIAKGSCSYRE